MQIIYLLSVFIYGLLMFRFRKWIRDVGFSKLDMSNVDMSKEAANEVKLSMQRIIREHMNS